MRKLSVLLLLAFFLLPATGADAAGPCDADPRTLWQKVLRVTGIAATPGQTRGLKDPPAGDLYLTTTDGEGARQRLTEGGGYRSPLFTADGGHVLALWKKQLVRVRVGRGVALPDPLMDLPGVVRLAGLAAGDPNVLVVLVEDALGKRPAAACPRERRLVELDVERGEVNKLLQRLRTYGRAYDDAEGVTLLSTREQEPGGADVEVRRGGGEAVELSRCGGAVCSQGGAVPRRTSAGLCTDAARA